jgi:hypothetical protein
MNADGVDHGAETTASGADVGPPPNLLAALGLACLQALALATVCCLLVVVIQNWEGFRPWHWAFVVLLWTTTVATFAAALPLARGRRQGRLTMDVALGVQMAVLGVAGVDCLTREMAPMLAQALLAPMLVDALCLLLLSAPSVRRFCVH